MNIYYAMIYVAEVLYEVQTVFYIIYKLYVEPETPETVRWNRLWKVNFSAGSFVALEYVLVQSHVYLLF